MKPYVNRSRLLSKTMKAIVAMMAIMLAIVPPLEASPRPPGGPFPESGLLYSEHFDEALGLPADQIDPSVFVESWSGYALNRQAGSTVTPWVIPMVGPTGAPRVDGSRGALRWWFMPAFTGTGAGGSGAGSQLTLVSLVSTNADSVSTGWTFLVTEDGNQVQLICPGTGGPAVCLSGQVTLQQGVWTMFTICYSETNSAIFANNQRIAVGEGLPGLPILLAPYSAVVIGSSLDGQPAAGQFEEFSAFGGSLRGSRSEWGMDPFWDIGVYYSDYASIAALGPVTDAEVTARQQARQQSRSTRLTARTVAAPTKMIFDGTAFVSVDDSFPPTSTNGLQLLSPPPQFGTFWSLQNPHGAPLPCSPSPDLAVFALRDGSFLMADQDFDYSALAALSSDSSERSDSALVGGSPLYSYDDGELWLEITNVSGGTAGLILHGTTNGPYTLLSRENLAITNWLVEQDIVGETDATPIQVPTFGRQTLFFWAHSGLDDGQRVLFVQMAGISNGVVNLLLYSTGHN